MNNPVHMRYATRWLRRVFEAVQPWRRDVYAVALDDDQGAYLDNDTWPAPHFHAYIEYLRSVAQRALPGVPVFINTYDMKVTASSPVWAWGNWYQSDAYSIGEHDRVQLEFTTGLLQTQARRPIMISEFQAGWLQDADQPAPRPADPSNTTLALHTLLQMGAHGVVNFPVQDTLNPAGWEAPWTNAFYSWDAALGVGLGPQGRYAPTAAFGALVRRYGALLAQTAPAADAAIAYTTSAFTPSGITNDDVASIAQRTMEAQRGCRIMRITCALVDLRYERQRDLARYRVLIVPPQSVRAHYIPLVREKLRAYRAGGGRIVASARAAQIASPAAGGIPNAALLAAPSGRFAFLDVVNYGRTALHTRAAHVHAGSFSSVVPPLSVPPRDALLLPLDVLPASAPPPSVQIAPPLASNVRIPLRAGSWVAAQLPRVHGTVYRADVYRDGYPAIVFENNNVRLIVSPCAGARALVFEDLQSGENLFTTVGGMRDAWSQPLAASPRDYIAKYTHPIETGTFNRCYNAAIDAAARAATFTYTAPDAPPHGARFRKTVSLDEDRGSFSVALSAHFTGSRTQRAQELTSFAAATGTAVLRTANAIGIYDRRKQRLVAVVWGARDVENAAIERHQADVLVTLTFAPGGVRHVRYAVTPAVNARQAQAVLRGLAKRR